MFSAPALTRMCGYNSEVRKVALSIAATLLILQATI